MIKRRFFCLLLLIKYIIILDFFIKSTTLKVTSVILILSSNYNLTDEHLMYLAKEIRSSPSLKEIKLNLCHNYFTSNGIKLLMADVAGLSMLNIFELFIS